MDIDQFADIVDTMIVQHDYPGFEPRSLKLGLPEAVVRAPARMFAQSLGHKSVFVKLAALRWFQEHAGAATPFTRAIAGVLADSDEWVRMEALRTLERLNRPDDEVARSASRLLSDSNQEVRKAAAKACGKICTRLKRKDPQVIDALKNAAEDSDAEVRWKVQKALRTLGEYAS